MRYLEDRGFKILDANFHSRFGEIDIVALKEEVIHFIEVKYSSRYEPIERIDRNKMRKILKTIELYLAKNAVERDFCVDALVIRGDEIELIENVSIM